MNINDYYEKTSVDEPHEILKKYFEICKVDKKNAIDLGCGAGRDTVFLLKKGFEVLAVDKEDTEEIIRNRLPEKENKNLKFLKENFEEIKLPKTNLIVSNFALSFCSKDKFEYLWNEIKKAINKNGYFLGNIFGINDEWNTEEKAFFTKEEVYKLLEKFNIIYFNEKEYDGKTAMGIKKHWHVFDIIAQKK